MLSASETNALLYQLCVKLGFCLDPAKKDAIVRNCPDTIDEFTRQMILAEGLEPDTVDRHLYRQVRAYVRNAFKESESWYEMRGSNLIDQ